MTEISTDLQEDVLLEETVKICDGLPEHNLHVLIIFKEPHLVFHFCIVYVELL
jgi:hypothetical protein